MGMFQDSSESKKSSSHQSSDFDVISNSRVKITEAITTS